MSRALPVAERRDRDAYFTPDALAEALVGLLPISPLHTVWEPHVGGGAFARAVYNRRIWLIVSDVHEPSVRALRECAPRRWEVGDFLDLDWHADWIIGNPPFRDAEAHIRHALNQAPRVAFLLRLAMLESKARAPLWRDHPPSVVYVLQERPSFTGSGTDSAAYGWFVWGTSNGPTELRWLSWR